AGGQLTVPRPLRAGAGQQTVPGQLPARAVEGGRTPADLEGLGVEDLIVLDEDHVHPAFGAEAAGRLQGPESAPPPPPPTARPHVVAGRQAGALRDVFGVALEHRRDQREVDRLERGLRDAYRGAQLVVAGAPPERVHRLAVVHGRERVPGAVVVDVLVGDAR